MLTMEKQPTEERARRLRADSIERRAAQYAASRKNGKSDAEFVEEMNQAVDEILRLIFTKGIEKRR